MKIVEAKKSMVMNLVGRDEVYKIPEFINNYVGKKIFDDSNDGDLYVRSNFDSGIHLTINSKPRGIVCTYSVNNNEVALTCKTIRVFVDTNGRRFYFVIYDSDNLGNYIVINI